MSYPPGNPGGFPQPGVPDPNQGFGQQQPQYGQPPADPYAQQQPPAADPYAQQAQQPPMGYQQPTSGAPGGYPPPPGDINLGGAPGFGVEPPKKSRKGLIIGISVAVVLALGGGGAWAAASFFGEDGTDTEAKLPESTAAFASFNLDVSKNQQLKLLDLAEKFPEANIKSDDPNKAVAEFIESLADDEEDFAKGKFADWVGLSASVALWEHGSAPYGIATVASTDDAKAKEGLSALQKEQDKKEFGFQVKDGTATLAFGDKDSQGAAEAAAKEAESKPLADSDKFSEAADFLGEGQVITAWADLDKTIELAEKEGGSDPTMSGALGSITQMKESMTGQFVMGAKAEDFGIEVVTSTFGAKDVTKGKDGLMDKMAKLPDSDIAGAVALPDDFSQSMTAAAGGLLTGGLMGGGSGGDVPPEMQQVFDALSGASGTISMQGVETSPEGQVVLETADADKANTLKGMLDQTGGQFSATVEGSTLTAQSAGYSANGELSKNEFYADAVGGAPDAISLAVFVDTTKLMNEQDKKEMGALKAVGAAFGSEGGEAVGNIRLVIK